MKNKGKLSAILRITAAVLIIVAAFMTLITYHCGRISSRHTLYEAEEGDIRIACVGDSITYGTLVFGWPGQAYPAELDKLLGDGYAVNNYGYAGRCAFPDADRPYVKEELFNLSLEFQPDIVIIMLGTNDTKTRNWKGEEAYKYEYGKLIDVYLSLESVEKMYIMAPPPVWEFCGKVWYNIEKDRVENELNRVARELAEEKGLGFIDLYEIFKNKRELFPDGVHPNAQGAEIIAETVYAEIIGGEIE